MTEKALECVCGLYEKRGVGWIHGRHNIACDLLIEIIPEESLLVCIAWLLASLGVTSTHGKDDETQGMYDISRLAHSRSLLGAMQLQCNRTTPFQYLQRR